LHALLDWRLSFVKPHFLKQANCGLKTPCNIDEIDITLPKQEICCPKIKKLRALKATGGF